MTTISQEIWAEMLPGQVPENCTYEQFCAARDTIEKEQIIDRNIIDIQKYQKFHQWTKSPETKSIMEQLIAISVEEIRSNS